MYSPFRQPDCFVLFSLASPILFLSLKNLFESLKQRIVVHYNYEGCLPMRQIILSRLEAAGGSRNLINEAAVHAVANFCQGTPRLINSLMTNALILGTQLQKTTIDTEIILAASNNLALC